MNKSQKLELVSFLKEKLTNSSFVSIVHYRGMNDKQLYDMRVAVRERGCSMKITKNTLVKVAIKGTDLEILTPHLNGPTAVLYSQDIVALSKVLFDMAKKSEVLKIKIGYFNKSLVAESAIREMAKLGSLDEVRASFIAVINSTQSRLIRILSAPEKGLATLKQC
jgi:large subunit ribosomal protein L10